jgi:hypothetical protein
MSALAGNLTGYEEATRALFAADGARFERYVSAWPADVGTHVKRLASAAFTDPGPADTQT